MPRKDGILAKWSGTARHEPDKALLTGRGSLRSRELLGQSPPGESKQSGRSSFPTSVLCPASSCAPRGRSGLAWRGPMVAALIGRRRGQQRGRHAPGPRGADKACHWAHDTRSWKSAWARGDGNRGPGPLLRFSSLGLGELPGGRACFSAELGDAKATSVGGYSLLPTSLPPFAPENKVKPGSRRVAC